MTLYQENRDLIMMGGYVAGQDQELDVAIQMWPQLVEHISQMADEKADYETSCAALAALTGS